MIKIKRKNTFLKRCRYNNFPGTYLFGAVVTRILCVRVCVCVIAYIRIMRSEIINFVIVTNSVLIKKKKKIV